MTPENHPASEFRNGEVTILLPGLYYFERGLTAQGTIIGGYEADQEGVALVFPQTEEFNVNVGGGGTFPTAISLNAGSKLNNPSGQEANAALDGIGNPIVTNTDPPLEDDCHRNARHKLHGQHAIPADLR